jgi:tripartite-type tricarboxylate transporter receptor subunit TctC
MSKKIYYFLICMLAFNIVLFCGFTSLAQYPEHKVDVIISYSPGGGTDVMARAIFPFVEEKLGVPFVIQNKPGAGSQIGYTATALSKPDGYTIGNINTMSIVTMEITRENVAFKLKEDIQPICQVVYDPSSIFVRKDSPFKTLEDLINYAKEHPGEVSYGGTAMWASHHVHMLMLERAAGIKLNYITFDGSAGTKAAILGGHIDVAAGGFTEFAQQVEEGELRALVSASANHWKDFPDVAIYSDLGYDIEIGASRGFAMRKGTPMERVELIANTIKEIMEEPEFIEQAKQVGIYPILSFRGPEAHSEFLYNLQDQMKEILPEDQLVD